MILAGVAVLSALATVVMVVMSAAGVFTTYTYNFSTGLVDVDNALPMWVAIIPGVVALTTGVGALVLWGFIRGPGSARSG